MKTLPLLFAIAAMALCASCTHKLPIVRTTTTSRAPGFGASAGGVATTVTETPYESPFRGKLGDAAINMFTP